MTANFVNSRQRILGRVALVLGVLLWSFFALVTHLGILLALVLGLLVYLYKQAGAFARVQNQGVELTQSQFPDIYAQYLECCERLKIANPPRVYLARSPKWNHTPVVRFFRQTFVLVPAQVLDGLLAQPDGLRFYFGHVLGRLQTQNLALHLVRWPALLLPLLGAAYARARESTWDRYGAACCSTQQSAAGALCAWSFQALGAHSVDVTVYAATLERLCGFWVSFHALIAGTSPLAQRVAALVDAHHPTPARHPLAYPLALSVPYLGGLGWGVRLLLGVCVFSLVAASVIFFNPEQLIRVRMQYAVEASKPARDAVASYYQLHQRIPNSLASVGVRTRLASDISLLLDTQRGTLDVVTYHGILSFTPMRDAQGGLAWRCSPGAPGMNSQWLPEGCQQQ